MRDVVIVGGTRTAVGAFGGSLKNMSAQQLGALVIKNVLKKTGLRPFVPAKALEMTPFPLQTPEKIEIERQADDWNTSLTPVAIDEVIMGNVLQAGLGQNPARQASIRAGLPKETPAFTVNKICGSGLKAIALAAASIRTGDAEAIIAGGQESMSNSPMALPKARWGYRMELSGSGEVQDLLVFDGLYEIFYGYHMGITAENIAAHYKISREEQDELAAQRHSRALAAIKNGLFVDEITKVEQKTRNGKIIIDYDERPMETDWSVAQLTVTPLG